MKKCPYCAEKIQDEAIVCRYCGRDLPVTFESQGTQESRTTPRPSKPSAWTQGAIVSVVITVLAAIGIYIKSQGPPFFLVRKLVIDSVVNFFLWWLVVTAIIAIWRKAGEKPSGRPYLGVGVLILAMAGVIIYGSISKSLPAFVPVLHSTPIPTAIPSPTIPYGFLYFDDFSNANSGWYNGTTSNGSVVEYVNRGYRIYAPDIHSLPNSILKSWDAPRDVRIEVDATSIGGDDQNTFGIICRYTEPSNFYYTGISTNGKAYIWKYINGEVRTITDTSKGFTEWMNNLDAENKRVSEYIHQGTITNHLRVDCIGNYITLYLNGELILTRLDISYSHGSVGLAAGTFDIGGTDILFDNFSVAKP